MTNPKRPKKSGAPDDHQKSRCRGVTGMRTSGNEGAPFAGQLAQVPRRYTSDSGGAVTESSAQSIGTSAFPFRQRSTTRS